MYCNNELSSISFKSGWRFLISAFTISSFSLIFAREISLSDNKSLTKLELFVKPVLSSNSAISTACLLLERITELSVTTDKFLFPISFILATALV